MTKKIQLIVEGEADVLAVPVLVKRILIEHGHGDVQLAQPAQRRGEITQVKRQFDTVFGAAVSDDHPVLCVLDFDCATCHDVLAEEAHFLAQSQRLRPSYPFRACFIVKEYESLFLWDAASTKASLPTIRGEYQFPNNPEAIRDAKGELSNAQAKGSAYKPTLHQVALSKKLNLAVVREKSPSFQRLEKAVLDLVESMK